MSKEIINCPVKVAAKIDLKVESLRQRLVAGTIKMNCPKIGTKVVLAASDVLFGYPLNIVCQEGNCPFKKKA